MKHYITIAIFLSLALPQDDRSTLFSTGNPPVLGEGWNIACSEYSSSIAGDINQDVIKNSSITSLSNILIKVSPLVPKFFII